MRAVSRWGDEIESLSQIDPLLGQVRQTYLRLPIYPKTHYVMTPQTRESALVSIERELEWWQKELENGGKLERAEFRREWVRVEPRAGERSLIEVSGQGRSVRVGRYVRPELRAALAREIRMALRSA